MNKSSWLRVLVGAVAIAFAWLVWPTPWRYLPGDEGKGYYAVRVHRLTGAVEVLVIRQTVAGWVSR